LIAPATDELLRKASADEAERIVPKLEWKPEQIKAFFSLNYSQGIRQEEMWEIMSIAGLIEESDFTSGAINHESLSRAFVNAKAMKTARTGV
jgi:hypothetical protein